MENGVIPEMSASTGGTIMEPIWEYLQALVTFLFKCLRGIIDRTWCRIKLYPSGVAGLLLTVIGALYAIIFSEPAGALKQEKWGALISLGLPTVAVLVLLLSAFVRWLRERFDLKLIEAKENPTDLFVRGNPDSLPRNWEISDDINGRAAFGRRINLSLDKARTTIKKRKERYKIPLPIRPYVPLILRT